MRSESSIAHKYNYWAAAGKPDLYPARPAAGEDAHMQNNYILKVCL
jgi:hypothetical protein